MADLLVKGLTFLTEAARLERIVRSSLSWETKYGLVFDTPLKSLVEWFDPDTSYHEDVLAFYEAVSTKAEEFKQAEIDIPI